MDSTLLFFQCPNAHGESEQVALNSEQLQELIAPEKIQFFDKSWPLIGEHDELSERIHAVTGIPKYALPFNGPQLDQYFSVHTRMLWASRRDTSRSEDSAYSLMGLFNVNMPLLYGEGDVAAFERLQDEIIKRTNDQSILLNRSTHGPLANYADRFRPYYSVEFERSDIIHHPPMQKTGRGLGVSLGLYPHSDGGARYWGIVEAYYGDDRTRLHRPALALVQKGGRVYGRESHLIYRVRPSNEGQMEVFSDFEHRRVDILQHGTGRREFIHLDYHRDEDPRDYRPLGPRLVLRPIVHKSALCWYEYTVLCPEPHGSFLVLAPPPSFYSISRGFLGAYTILRTTGAGPASPDLALLVLHLPGSFEDIFPYLVDLQSWPEGEEAGTDVYDYRGAENRLLSLPIVTKHYENPDLDAVLSCISQLWKEYIRNGRASIVLSNGVRVDAWVKEKMFLEDKLYYLRVEVD
ncbi:hypothetical protein ANO14919_012520 [Xylariales sp. No.14919]|nr:hypothetical protein ANO14919_012520 [Xylariales sp. No.14919]